ncbi:MAG TPA: hypothetical protein VF628_09930 [Allosphingosinicella sp.]
MTKKRIGSGSTGADRRKAAMTLVPSNAASKNAIAVSATEAGGAVYRDKGTTLIANEPYALGGQAILADAVYFVDDSKSREDGPWLGEADKIAWRDRATGFECIIMRSRHGGYLGGYVGVPQGHPLYGFDHAAIPSELDVEVHGGITYSRACEHGPPSATSLSNEAQRICHVPRVGERVRVGPATHATGYRVQDDDAWWFGFECNHVYDLVPSNPESRGRFLAAETGPVYRDEAYVYGEVTHLAEQLHAIASGSPKPPRSAPSPPPLGLDPRKED